MGALLVAPSIKEAAALCHVPLSTAYRIASEDDFRQVMAEHRRSLVDAAVITAGTHVGSAFATLIEVMQNADERGGVRVMAADKLLLHAGTYLDRADIIERLDRLERMDKNEHGPSPLDAVGRVLEVTRT